MDLLPPRLHARASRQRPAERDRPAWCEDAALRMVPSGKDISLDPAGRNCASVMMLAANLTSSAGRMIRFDVPFLAEGPSVRQDPIHDQGDKLAGAAAPCEFCSAHWLLHQYLRTTNTREALAVATEDDGHSSRSPRAPQHPHRSPRHSNALIAIGGPKDAQGPCERSAGDVPRNVNLQLTPTRLPESRRQFDVPLHRSQPSKRDAFQHGVSSLGLRRAVRDRVPLLASVM